MKNEKKTVLDVILKDGRSVKELSPLEAALVAVRHGNPDDLENYNPDQATAQAAARAAQPTLEKKFGSDLPLARKRAEEAQQVRAETFKSAVRENVLREGAEKSTAWILMAIERLISDDDAKISRETAKGGAWSDLLCFPRKDAKGNRYSKRFIEDEIRKVKAELRK